MPQGSPEKTGQSAINLGPSRRQPRQGCKNCLSAPESLYCQPGQTRHTQQPSCVLLSLLPDPQDTAMGIDGSPRLPQVVNRRSSCLRLPCLTQPCELPVIILGTRRGWVCNVYTCSSVPPESAGQRNQAGDNPSRCAGCGLSGLSGLCHYCPAFLSTSAYKRGGPPVELNLLPVTSLFSQLECFPFLVPSRP